MKLTPISKAYAISVARQLLARLRKKGVPVRDIRLFGSASKEETHAWSDIDIAVICDPFLESKYDEQHICSREARSIDVRAEIVCLHPSDLENKYSTLAQEVRRYGTST